MADVNWRHGSLVTPPTPAPPESVGADGSIGALLDEAEDIINAAGGRVRGEVEADQARQSKRWLRRWWPFGR